MLACRSALDGIHQSKQQLLTRVTELESAQAAAAAATAATEIDDEDVDTIPAYSPSPLTKENLVKVLCFEACGKLLTMTSLIRHIAFSLGMLASKHTQHVLCQLLSNCTN